MTCGKMFDTRGPFLAFYLSFGGWILELALSLWTLELGQVHSLACLWLCNLWKEEEEEWQYQWCLAQWAESWWEMTASRRQFCYTLSLFFSLPPFTICASLFTFIKNTAFRKCLCYEQNGSRKKKWVLDHIVYNPVVMHHDTRILSILGSKTNYIQTSMKQVTLGNCVRTVTKVHMPDSGSRAVSKLFGCFVLPCYLKNKDVRIK